jgi:hypothetical protein
MEQIKKMTCIELTENSKIPSKPWNDESTHMPYEVIRRNTRCNVGILTGQELEDGMYLLVVDIDVHRPEDNALEFYAEQGFPETLTISTPSGGYHCYFKYKRPLPNTASKIHPGVDTRGLGGYVVAPYSKIDGIKYDIIRDVKIKELPVKIAYALSERVKPKVFISSTNTEAPLYKNRISKERAINFVRRFEWVEGTRNNDWYRLSHWLLDKGLKPECLDDVAEAVCEASGMTMTECHKTTWSAERKHRHDTVST